MKMLVHFETGYVATGANVFSTQRLTLRMGTRVWWVSDDTLYLEDIMYTEGRKHKRCHPQARVEIKRMKEEKAETPVAQSWLSGAESKKR